MRSIRPRRSDTCCAVVGETCPERFAEGASHHRPPRRCENLARDGMARHAHGDGVEPCRRELRNGAARVLWQDKRQWSRPERRRNSLGRCIKVGEPMRGRAICHMRNQGIERGPPLGIVQAGHGRGITGVAAQAIDRLGRKCGEPAPREHARCRCD